MVSCLHDNESIMINLSCRQKPLSKPSKELICSKLEDVLYPVLRLRVAIQPRAIVEGCKIDLFLFNCWLFCWLCGFVFL